jgi:hypothetical protein
VTLFTTTYIHTPLRMDPNAEERPPTAHIAEVDVDIQTEVCRNAGIGDRTDGIRPERYLLRILRWNLSWRARSSGGHLMMDHRRGGMCRDHLDSLPTRVSDPLGTSAGRLMSSRSRGC